MSLLHTHNKCAEGEQWDHILTKGYAKLEVERIDMVISHYQKEAILL